MRKMTILAGLAFVSALCGAGRADDWDFGSDTDNGVSTDNVLLHGSEQLHDLQFLIVPNVPDQDWYLVASRPFSSYQVAIDGMTGDLDLAGASVQRIDPSGTIVLGSAVATDLGGNLSLDWQQGTGAAPVSSFVRVQGAACGTNCGTFDNYRIHFYETTYTIPRFNNSGTQATVLLVQNATDRTCDVTYFFLGAGGSLLAASPSQLLPRELEVIASATIVPSQSGSVRVAHTCGYGGLSGKAVALEPATGFTFDTQMAHRPH